MNVKAVADQVVKEQWFAPIVSCRGRLLQVFAPE